MIPKKIHYCWFGGNPLPDDVRKYIATWKEYCPDYEIIEWNEQNFDINCNDYVREAYEAKKWAFVTDYVRLYALYHHGGIYMDTDVEVVKSLNDLLVYDAVSGYESKTSIPTGTIAACRDNEWIGMLLADYDNRHFIQEDGSLDMTTNVKVITRLTVDKYGLSLDGTTTKFGKNMILLPFEYLCAKSYRTGEVIKTSNTYTIHHFSGSWVPQEERHLHTQWIEYFHCLNLLPDGMLRSKIATLLAVIKVEGLSGVFKRILIKIRQYLGGEV